MGTYATYVDVHPSRLVRVPDLLPSDIAAAVPLDVVTAGLAMRLARLPRGGRLLVQGVAGSVGTFVAQGALRQDVTVFGTASAENRAVVEQRGVHFLDYRDANWMTKLREEASGRMDAAIDHTGGNSIRSMVSPRGTVVRTAFAGRAGHELRDTATGSLRTLMRHFASPRERVCSVPAFVAVNTSDYRRLLSSQFDRLTDGTLTAPTVDTEELGDVVTAHEKLSTVAPGHKLVLQMPTLKAGQGWPSGIHVHKPSPHRQSLGDDQRRDDAGADGPDGSPERRR